MNRLAFPLAAACLALAAPQAASAQTAADMSFFVTSAGPGKGADLGGLAGADAHCAKLASAAGAGGKAWRAYLSADAADGKPAVNARDRIGSGPWKNAKGVVIASSVADLHGAANKLTKETALSEKGEVINGRGDKPNRHDILTGSDEGGMLVAGKTCSNWTSSAEDGTAFVGHHDRIGLRDDAPSKSWNASHGSRGCSQDKLKASGGDGLLYCFAAN
jgi:hypothetical protein